MGNPGVDTWKQLEHFERYSIYSNSRLGDYYWLYSANLGQKLFMNFGVNTIILRTFLVDIRIENYIRCPLLGRGNRFLFATLWDPRLNHSRGVLLFECIGYYN